MTEDEKVGWHHQLDGHVFEQALGVGDGEGQSPSAVILESKKRKSVTASTFSPSICQEVMGIEVKEMATHSSILSWRIPWIKEPDSLQSMGLQKIRHN